MKRFLWSIFLLWTLAGTAAAQSKYEAASPSAREAIGKGEAREFLSAMEALAAEARGEMIGMRPRTPTVRAPGLLQIPVNCKKLSPTRLRPLR